MKDDELSSDTLVPQDRHCNCSPSNDPKQVLQYLCNTIGDDVACEKKSLSTSVHCLSSLHSDYQDKPILSKSLRALSVTL